MKYLLQMNKQSKCGSGTSHGSKEGHPGSLLQRYQGKQVCNGTFKKC